VPKKPKTAVQPVAPANPAAAPPPAAPATPPAAPPTLITSTANGSNHTTKVGLQASIQAVISGLITYYEPTDMFQMNGETYTRDELVAEFQSFVTAAQATKTSNQQWRTNVQAERALELHVRSLRKGVEGIVNARFGPEGAQNLQFGFAMAKPRVKSAETKAAAVVKGLATREKRGTLGKVQKKDIKSNVSVALVVTPEATQNAAQPTAAAPAAQSVSAAPAAAPAQTATQTPPATPHTGGTAT
jgi:hypothetical protein